MAALFPTLSTEEPFFSAITRYAEAMRFPDVYVLNKSLYDGFAERPAGEFPGYLEAFVSRLPPGHPYTVEGLLWDHTPLPYIYPFYPRSQVRRAIADMRTQPVSKSGDGMFARPRFDPQTPLRFCRRCVEFDRATSHGVPYWRRVHQLPGVMACPDHRVPLCLSEVGPVWVLPSDPYHKYYNRGISSLAAVLDQKDEWEPVPLEGRALDVALEVADDSLWLLQHAQTADQLATVMERHRLHLGAAGFLNARGRVRRRDLGAAIVARMGDVLGESSTDPTHVQYVYRWHFGSMWGGIGNPVLPVYHILQFRTAGVSAAEFFAGPPPSVVRRTPSVGVLLGPCRNVVCEARGQPPPFSPRPVPQIVLVACPRCGYTYARRSDRPGRPRWRVLRLGSRWSVRFRALVRANVPLPELVRELGVGEMRLMHEGFRLNAWSRRWPREIRAALVAERSASYRKLRGLPYGLRNLRRRWKNAVARGSGLQGVIAEEARAFRLLLKYDAEWLGEHLTDPRVPPAPGQESAAFGPRLRYGGRSRSAQLEEPGVAPAPAEPHASLPPEAEEDRGSTAYAAARFLEA
jgi:hypothetical protein